MHSNTRWRLVSGAALLVLVGFVAEAPAQPVPAPYPRAKPEAAAPVPAGAVARIGRPRLKTPGSTIHVAFAPTGTTFVSASNAAPNSTSPDRLVVLWHAATGKEVRDFKGHLFGVEALAFSRDGKQIVTGGLDKSVRLWDVASGEEIARFNGHTNRVLAVAYSPDQKRVASMAQDATVRIWDANTARELRRVPGRNSQGTSNLQFSPDGTVLAVVGADSAIRFYDPETGDSVAKFTGPTVDSLSLDFTRDGKRLAAISEDGKLWVWDVATEKELLRVQAHKGVGSCVRFSPDGSVLATGGSDGTIRYWDLKGNMLRSSTGHPANNVSEISYSADGSVLASAGHEGTIRLWDAATGLERPQSGGTVARVALSPDGRRLATAGDDPLVRFWEPATGNEILPPLRTDRPARVLEFAPDGRTLITAHSGTEFRVWDLETGTEVRTVGSHTEVLATRSAVGPGGRYLALAGQGSAFRLWNLTTGEPAAHPRGLAADIRRFPPTRALALSRSGARFAWGGDLWIRVWDLAGERELCAVPGAGGPPGPVPGTNALAWAPDGRTFASVGAAELSLRVHEALGGGERVRVALPAIGLSVAFSPDGRLVAAGGYGFFRLWDARTGKQLAARNAHSAPVAFLAFTADGRFLVTAGTDVRVPVAPRPGGTAGEALQIGDGTALVWNVAALVTQVPPVPKPTAAETEALWGTLAGADPAKAADAVWRLAAAPDLALPLVKDRLAKLAGGDTDKRVEQLLVELDDDDFDVREKATQELIRLGARALPAVQNASAATKSREVARRTKMVLDTASGGSAPSAEEVLLARAIEVLQRTDTPDSRRLLETWAAGPAGSALTREARTALGLIRSFPEGAKNGSPP